MMKIDVQDLESITPLRDDGDDSLVSKNMKMQMALDPLFEVFEDTQLRTKLVKSVLKEYPDLKNKFTSSDSKKTAAFIFRMLKRGVKLVASNSLNVVEQLMRRHPGYGVYREHFAATRKNMLALCKLRMDKSDHEELTEVVNDFFHEFESRLEPMPDDMVMQLQSMESTARSSNRSTKGTAGINENELMLLKTQFDHILRNKEVVCKTLAELLMAHDDLKAGFGAKGINVAKQAPKILAMIHALMKLLHSDDGEDFGEALVALGERHERMNIPATLIKEMKEILMELFKRSLGFLWEKEAEQTWRKFWEDTVQKMTEGLFRAENEKFKMQMSETSFSAQEIAEAQEQWGMLENVRDAALDTLYNALVQEKPALSALFDASLKEQQVLSMYRVWSSIVHSLDDLEGVMDILLELGARHVYYGVDPSDFAHMEVAFLKMMRQGVGIRWKDSSETLWLRVYRLVSSCMKQSLRQAYTVYTPPESTKVQMKLLIHNLDKIEPVNHSFYSDIWFGAFTCGNPSQSAAFKGLDQANAGTQKQPEWTVQILNAMDTKDVIREGHTPWLRSFDDETHYVRGQIRGTFSQHFDLHQFPFDQHVLKFRISLMIDADKYTFDPEHLVARTLPFKRSSIGGSEWMAGDPKIFVEQQGSGTDGKKKYAYARVEVPIARKPHHHLYQTILPLTLITSLSFCVYFIQHDDLSGRVMLLTTLLLTIFAFKWTIAETMPPVAYHTLLDRLFYLSYFLFAFHSWVSCIFGYVVVHKPSLTYTFDYVDGTIFLISFSAYVVYLWKQYQLWMKLIDDFPKPKGHERKPRESRGSGSVRSGSISESVSLFSVAGERI